VAHQAGEVVRQHLPQPGHQLALGRPAELGERRVGVEEGFLNEVRRIDLALQPPPDLEPGQQFQVVAIPLQQLTQGVGVPAAGQRQQALNGLAGPAHDNSSAMLAAKERGIGPAPTDFFYGNLPP
jgi:hypothetical protein